MPHLHMFVIAGGALLFGFLVIPVLVVAVASLGRQVDPAYHLLKAFDDRYPESAPMAQTDFDGIARDCGYADQLFGSDRPSFEGQNWTPYTGYFDLHMWLTEEFRDETERRRAEQLRQHLTNYELTFLDGCLRKTVFADLCGGQVRRILNDGNLLDQYSLNSPFPQPRRTQTICIYLDGIAARKGQPLARRSS